MTQALPGFKTLLIGEAGAGKTHVTRTLLATGIQPLVLSTEPGMRALARCETANCSICKTVPADAPAIPWAYVSPMPGDITTLLRQAELINTRDQKFLCNINDGDRKLYNQYWQVLKLIENYVDNTGKSWGPVAGWNTDRALIFDGLGALGDMAMNSFVGKRPLYDKSDYQVAQIAVKNLIILLTCQFRCHVVVIGHVDRGENELGSGRITVSTVGRKLAPELPKWFDDMPHAEKNGDKFTWSTARPSAVCKNRNLPLNAALAPDFRQIVEAWQRAGGVIVRTELSPASSDKAK